MRYGIVLFPGTWSDRDCHHALQAVLKQDVGYIWHKDTDLSGYDCIVLPGGFSYGDYLRPGAIARFSPVMGAVRSFAAAGGLVVGICNGFQILCEAGLLPGVLMPNNHLEYRCQWVHLRVDNAATPFSGQCQIGQVLKIPISHHDGNYYVDAATLDDMERRQQVVFRYASPSGEVSVAANPNGSLRNIAGITNRQGNVLGMMPHPERACEAILGSVDGKLIFGSASNHR